MKYEKGDKVYVRAWQEMQEDERVLRDHKGNLYEKDKPGNSFVKSMRRYCGSAAEIDEVTEDGGFRLVFGDYEKPGYIFREWAIEPGEKSVTVYIVEKGD